MNLQYRILKRIFDFSLSLLLGVPALFFSIPIVLLIFLDDRTPVLYITNRIGIHTKKFRIFKFRTMFNIKNNNNYFTSHNDPRVTCSGKFLRKFSLDELPQLINVLKGDMSLVGPRPDSPEMFSLYDTRDWEKRHIVKPGITGLAQVSGRSELSKSHRLKYDLFYVKKHSFILDLKILFRTILHLLFKRSF
jgi:undecaprenyl phosphate N,N'-diacetylbacillosamine 1-phosphate transferase